MLILVIIAAVLIMVVITLLFMFSTKTAYKFEHKIDPIPTEKEEHSDIK